MAENKESISLTFHYLFRVKKDENGENIETPITQEEFQHLYTKLKSLKGLDLKKDKALQSELRAQKVVAILELDEFDDLYICGRHYKSYSGHEIENLDVGTISKDSINLRKFFFVLYLSKDGKLYIGSQALGNFSGYVALRDCIKSLFKNSKGLNVASVRSTGYITKNAKIKEIQVPYSRKTESGTKSNHVGKKGVIILKESDSDAGFSDEIKTSILPFLDKERKEIKKAVAEVVRDNALMAVNDDDLDECRLIVYNKGGGTRVIQMLDKSGWPTYFDTGLEPSPITGHPDYEEVKKAALEILEEEVLDIS